VAAAPLDDAIAEALLGNPHALADRVTCPLLAALLREPNPFGKPQTPHVWSRCYTDVLLIRIDLNEQRDAIIEVAIEKIWKFGVGKTSVVPGKMAEGRIAAKHKARAAALVEAMPPRVRRRRVEYLRSILAPLQALAASPIFETRK
jgi:hypothetical protein